MVFKQPTRKPINYMSKKNFIFIILFSVMIACLWYEGIEAVAVFFLVSGLMLTNYL